MTVTAGTAQIVPITRRSDAAAVATRAYEDLVALLESLEDRDWLAPTECPGWTVSDMVGHLIGNARSGASTREMLRQNLYGVRHAREHDGNPMDAYNALQVREHAALGPAERVAALRDLTRAAVDGRMRTPRVLRAVSAPVKNNGSMVRGMPTWISVGHLADVILSRDVFMHRVDISRAVGRSLVPTDNDRRLVEDAVKEWADRHGQPVELVLTGPAGATFVQGSGGARIEMDAVEFCRVLSGRAPGSGLLETKIFF